MINILELPRIQTTQRAIVPTFHFEGIADCEILEQFQVTDLRNVAYSITFGSRPRLFFKEASVQLAHIFIPYLKSANFLVSTSSDQKPETMYKATHGVPSENGCIVQVWIWVAKKESKVTEPALQPGGEGQTMQTICIKNQMSGSAPLILLKATCSKIRYVNLL